MRTGLLLPAAAFLCLTACSTPQKGDSAGADGDDGWVEVAPESIRAISAPHTPIYRYGPSQATGPDALLKKDALVSVVRKEFGFSRVRTEDNLEGYVANDRLAKAPDDHPPFGMSASIGMGLPEYRTDTTGAPEWLEVGTVDQMLIDNPPGELLMPEGVDGPPPEPSPEPATTPTPPPASEPAAPSSSTTPNSNG